MRKKLCALLTGVLFAALIFTGCGGDTEVSVQSVGMITGLGSVGMFDKYAGIVESGETVEFEKDESMEVKEVLVSVGDPVTVGQTLFSYNTESVSLDLDKLQLELEQLKNSITTKNSQISVLEKERNSASSDSKLDYTLQIQSLQVEVKEAEINVTSKEKEIERTRSVLQNAEVKSTVNGTVKSVNTSGNVDQNTGMPLPFVTVTQTGDYRVKGIVNEQNAASLIEGTNVIIRARVGSKSWAGSIATVDFEHPEQNNNNNFYVGVGDSDEMTVSTNYPFYITLEDDEGLMLGQHVYIEPDLGQDEQEGFFLPANFVVVTETESYVWAANSKDKLEKRLVTLGSFDEELNCYEILDGLTAADYIADPSEDCVEGAPVTYYDEDSFGGDIDNSDNGENAGDENIDGESGFEGGDNADNFFSEEAGGNEPDIDAPAVNSQVETGGVE